MKESIEGLTKTPPEGDIKPMSGYKDGSMRVRRGKNRIVYRYFLYIDESGQERKGLYIKDADSRGGIYK